MESTTVVNWIIQEVMQWSVGILMLCFWELIWYRTDCQIIKADFILFHWKFTIMFKESDVIISSLFIYFFCQMIAFYMWRSWLSYLGQYPMFPWFFFPFFEMLYLQHRFYFTDISEISFRSLYWINLANFS